MIAGLTYLDAALLVVVLLSGIVAMYRGLTREVLSILSWAVAAGAVLYFVKFHKGIAEELAKQFANPVQNTHIYIAQIAVGGVIFLIVLIAIHLITSRIADTVLDSRIGIIDRVLGLAFGAARGFVIVLIPYMFAVSFMCKDSTTHALSQGCRSGELPFWVEKSNALPIIRQSSGVLYGILTRYAPSSLQPQQQS